MLLTSSLSTDLLIFFVGLLVLLYFYAFKNNDYWKKRGVPYIKPVPFLGSFPKVFTLRKSMGITCRDLYLNRKEPYIGIFLLSKPQLFIRDRNLIKTILIEGFSHFVDRNLVTKGDQDTIGSNMLFFMGSPDWNNYRKKITPVYTSGKLKAMYPLFEEVGSGLISYLSKIIETTDTLDIKQLAARYSTELITSTAFGLNAEAFSEEPTNFFKAGRKIVDFGSLGRSTALMCYFFLPAIVDLFRVKLIDPESAAFFKRAFGKTLKQREDTQIVRNDMIDILIQMKKSGMLENDELDGDKMFAQAVQFFLGGYETTSTTIGFALYELAKNPDVQVKLRQEIQNMIKDHGHLSYELLSNSKSSHYLNMVLKETLRKYPPFPSIDRKCNEDFLIPGTDLVIEKGIGVYIPIMGLHMDPENFPNPEDFIPERFSEENIKNIKPFTYLPYGDGPRNCIGSRFGSLGSKYAIASVILNFEVEMCEATPMKMEFHRVAPLLAPLNHKLLLKYKKLNTNITTNSKSQ